MVNPLLLGVVVGLALSQVATLVTTVYLHRALAHRGLSLSPGTERVTRVLTWVMTGIRPRQWVAVHRKHHAHTDVEGDPHSPLLEGFAMVQFANVALYRRVARDPRQVARYARDLPADRWDRLLLDRAWLGLGLGLVVLWLLLGPVVALVAGVVHAVSYLLLNAAVNAVGHRFGRRPHDDNLARNAQWLAWITAGEGLHNNHHHRPTSARLSMAPGEVDPGWWAVGALCRLGLARVRERRREGPGVPAAA
jgi:stearoyl-CoA desaturase (Delta-9 desaturase)